MLNIKFYRLEAEMLQRELADKVGVSQPKICQLEKGIQKVSYSSLVKIAKVLNFPDSPEKLLDHVKREIEITELSANTLS